jgi:hypothetical protein
MSATPKDLHSAAPMVSAAAPERGINGALLAIALVSVGLSCWCLHQIRVLQADVDARPPLAVIPVSDALVAAAQRGGTDTEHVATQLKSLGARLRAKGYIVLNGDSLVAYPKEYVVNASANADGEGTP